jgi:FkbM family methyltransferase
MTRTLAAELDELLAESPSQAMVRERSEFDRQAGPARASVVLFGARKMGRLVLGGLRRNGVEPLAFSDNDPKVWGETIEGVAVLSPEDAAKRFGDSAIFVITAWGRGASDPMHGRIERLRMLGCKRVITVGPVFWKYPSDFLPRIPATDLPHKVLEQADRVRRVFALLGDDRSRQEFVAQLRWRLHFDFDALPEPVTEPIYFPADLIAPSDDEVFVDVGAFDGDSILDFLRNRNSRFGGIIAFEPDPVSLERLRQTLDGLPDEVRAKVRVIPAATGAQSGTVRFSATGALGSRMDAGEVKVDLVTLDDSLKADSPTFIKMDIEGAETSALEGARKLIARTAPVLAICTYHVQDHLWKIPELIHQLQPDYRIYLRPHIQQVEDLVTYAVPAGRQRGVKESR